MPAKMILIEGEPGTGKSTSLENLSPEETYLIVPNSKDLPFEGSRNKYIEKKNKVTTNNLSVLPALIKQIAENTKIKYIVIEDFTHFFNTRTTDPSFLARSTGNDAYSRWMELASDTARIINGVAEELKDDQYLIFIGHTTSNDKGEEVLLTPGKLLDNSIKVSSYFTYIFHTLIETTEKSTNYLFLTNRFKGKEAKTPKGMFKELKIQNDLMSVINIINKYQTK